MKTRRGVNLVVDCCVNVSYNPEAQREENMSKEDLIKKWKNQSKKYPFREWVHKTRHGITAEQAYPWKEQALILDGRRVEGVTTPAELDSSDEWQPIDFCSTC